MTFSGNNDSPGLDAFTEVGDRVWVARREWYDVNITVIGGDAGWLIVDTHASDRAAAELLPDLRRLAAGGRGPRLVGIVNTHAHFDHVFGNARLLAEFGPAPVWAQERAAEETLIQGRAIQERARGALAAGTAEPHDAEFAETRLHAADKTFSSVAAIDLGDRLVELIHPGRGHTDGDLVVTITDAGVLLAGDLVEEAEATDHTPGFGDDSHPLEWPATLDVVLAMTRPDTVVIPGHGAPVDRRFVEDQRDAIAGVAEQIRSLAAGGVPLAEALGQGQWPYPAQRLTQAVARGYAQLPLRDFRAGGRSLPILNAD